MKSLLLLLPLFFLTLTLKAQEIPENLSDEEKIYGLSKVWKEVDKNFVFFDQVPDLDWDKTYQSYIPKVLATQSTYEYYKTLQAFCALLKDGHTRVVVPWQLRRDLEVPPAIKTELIGDKVIITEILNDTLKQQGISVGMEITEIDGIRVHEYAKQKILPYTFYSTTQDRDVHVYEKSLLKGPASKALIIKTADGQRFSIDRNLRSSATFDPTFDFKVLEDGVGYLRICRFWGEGIRSNFDSIYQKISTVDKLIIDVSINEGGNSGHAHYVLSHFVDKSFEASRWKTLIYMPAYASWGWNTQWQDNSGDIINPVKEEKRFSKPVVVLISEKTYSAGEDFVSAFLNTERGEVLGRPTAGTTGNPIGFGLPGGGGVQICSKRDYLSNGKEFVGYGIAPTQLVKKTMDEDHLIHAGLNLLKQNK